MLFLFHPDFGLSDGIITLGLAVGSHHFIKSVVTEPVHERAKHGLAGVLIDSVL